ncbi:MAG: transporter substrate-binding domain-containing protein [Solobacterium sp.]|nr:transporter substrate-binding domain-containing protein [Solobacterium sp.]
MQNRRIQWKLAACFLLLMTSISVLAFVRVSAEEDDRKTVRVGWYDSSFCYWDEFGRRRGIDYEYQQKISAYTGWTYEYVEDSWPNLLQMLSEGEIDLLSDVSYKPERTEFMLFPDLPMGTESYYIYIDGENREITTDNFASFNGKRIGVNKGSIQEGFLKDWAEHNRIDIDILPLDVDEAESVNMLSAGQIDGYATVYTFSSEWKIIPVCRVGSSGYFYAVNRNRPDLLAELNMALSGIQDDDPYFNQRMSEERLYSVNVNAFLTPAQDDWLAHHGPIRIGYQDDYLPFCDYNPENGELTGALRDYLVHAQNNLRSSNIQFDLRPFRTSAEALAAMNEGEVDAVFPVNLSSYDAEQMGIRLTSPAMETEMNAIKRSYDHQALSRDSQVCIAFAEDDVNTKTFIMDLYPALPETQ